MRIAIADGPGTPRALFPTLNRAALRHRDLDVVLGWVPVPETGFEPRSFREARTVVGGAGLRSDIESGAVSQVPSRLSGVPSLLAGPLRPDLLLATLVRGPDGLHFGAEVSWMRGLVAAGVPVAAVVSTSAPLADAGPPLPLAAIHVVAEIGGESGAPREIATPTADPIDRAIAAQVVTLVPAGARVQIGPGRLAAAMVAALRVPVRVDSGLLGDAVVDLDERGLLIGVPIAAYLAGTRRLYNWADGRAVLHPIEVVHDVGRLSSVEQGPLIALNTALEIDADGQVNVEGNGAAATGMIGGHPDFAAAGVRSVGGLSVIALASTWRGRPTLVDVLSRPVTTTSQDVDFVVTERGQVDLRGLDRSARRAALRGLWSR